MVPLSDKIRGIKAVIKDLLIGATVYDMIRDLEERMQYGEYLLMLVVFGDMLGYPVPSYYRLRLLSICLPKLDLWKKAMLRERDVEEKAFSLERLITVLFYFHNSYENIWEALLMLNVKEVRKDFPILETGIIYLDNTASSLTPEPVLQKMLEFYRQYRANVERGIHRLSQKASEEYERAHAKVADFINARSESEIVMTRNTTEGINIIANGLNWKKEDKIVTSLIEHHSNFIVWLRVKNRHGVDLEIIKPSKPIVHGLLNPADFEKVVDDKTKLVAVTHVSNVLGVITPVKEIAEIAHEHGAYVLLDGAQSVPHMKVDVQKIGCDFLAFSGHKMCAPTGSSALYVREEVIEEVEPLCIGGGTIADVGLDYYRLERSPMRFEAGTPAIAEAIGLGAAIDYLRKIGMENIERYEKGLTKQMYEGLREIPKVEVYGPEPERKVSITSFNVGDLNHHDAALALDVSANIMVRSGHHCALPLTKSLIRRPGSVRASTYFYNTKEEINKLISTVKEIAETLAR